MYMLNYDCTTRGSHRFHYNLRSQDSRVNIRLIFLHKQYSQSMSHEANCIIWLKFTLFFNSDP